MSSPTPPITDPARTAPAPSEPDSIDPAGLAAEPSRSEAALPIDISCASPPEEVLEQMAHADAINSRLRGRGYQISFALSADARCLQIELRDVSGALLRTLSAEEAVGIAAGGPVD